MQFDSLARPDFPAAIFTSVGLDAGEVFSSKSSLFK